MSYTQSRVSTSQSADSCSILFRSSPDFIVLHDNTCDEVVIRGFFRLQSHILIYQTWREILQYACLKTVRVNTSPDFRR